MIIVVFYVTVVGLAVNCIDLYVSVFFNWSCGSVFQQSEETHKQRTKQNINHCPMSIFIVCSQHTLSTYPWSKEDDTRVVYKQTLYERQMSRKARPESFNMNVV